MEEEEEQGEQPSERIRDDLGLPFVLIMVKFR